jgi:hypothetical protein
MVLDAMLVASFLAHGINPEGFPNSITEPIRGWRSWNAVMEGVSQSFISRQVVAISARTHSPPGAGGEKKSLLDLGYSRVGIDAGWASCTGVNGSWHDDTGHFIVNVTKFPDMKAMNAHAHSLGVKMGFYLNQDGLCKEGSIPGASCRSSDGKNCVSYKNDIEDMVAFDFDGVKFDSGGGNDDANRWALEINRTGREIMIENCNNGGDVPYKPPGLGPHPPHAHGPYPTNCPFNIFRTGIDNAPSPLSMVSNLIDASRYFNVSFPGCMAYPDMLELGAPVVGEHATASGRRSMCNASDGTVGDSAPRLTVEQGKAEFAAWCTVSSPLVLGFDLGNETEYERWYPIIAHPLALSIQAAYSQSAGKGPRITGRFLAQSTRSITTVVPHGCACEDMKDTRSLPSWTIWGKPINSTSWAVTAINTDQEKEATVAVRLSAMGFQGAVSETDVWSGRVRRLDASASEWSPTVPAGAHRFVVLRST